MFREQAILKEIAVNGRMSGKMLAKNFNRKLPTINPIIKKLEKNGIIKKTIQNNTKTRGRQEKFYCLTAKGISSLLRIKDIEMGFTLTLTQFFQLLFYANDLRTSYQKMDTCDLLANYENKFLLFDRQVFPFLISGVFEWTKSQTREWLNECIRVIELLGDRKLLSAEEIFAFLGADESNFTWDQHAITNGYSPMLQKLIMYGLISEIEVEQKKKFTLSIFGLLILLRCLYRKPSFETGLFLNNYDLLSGSDKNAAKIRAGLRLLHKNYPNLLSKIFDNFSLLKKTIPKEKVRREEFLLSFMVILFFTKDIRDNVPYYLSGHLGLFNIQHAMAVEYYDIVKRELSNGINAWIEWAEKSGVKLDHVLARDLLQSGEISKRLDEYHNEQEEDEKQKEQRNPLKLSKQIYYAPDVMNLLVDLEKSRITKDDLLMEDTSIQKALRNEEILKSISETIEFQFYAFVRTWIKEWKKFLKKSGLSDWFTRYESTILQFGKNKLQEIEHNVHRTTA